MRAPHAHFTFVFENQQQKLNVHLSLSGSFRPEVSVGAWECFRTVGRPRDQPGKPSSLPEIRRRVRVTLCRTFENLETGQSVAEPRISRVRRRPGPVHLGSLARSFVWKHNTKRAASKFSNKRDAVFCLFGRTRKCLERSFFRGS